MIRASKTNVINEIGLHGDKQINKGETIKLCFY